MNNAPKKLTSADYFFSVPALVFLGLSIMAGITIRLEWVLPHLRLVNTPFTIHAHSHLALLGWLFPIFIRFLLPDELHLNKNQKWLIVCLHTISLLMFTAFIYQGYALWSILFSSLFLLVSYFIIKSFWGEFTSPNPILVQIALVFYLISTIGPWLLGLTVKFGAPWMNAWVAWFLHFQFNGWIAFALLALLLPPLKKPEVTFVWLIAFCSELIIVLFMSSKFTPWFVFLNIPIAVTGILATYYFLKPHLFNHETGLLKRYLLVALFIKFIVIFGIVLLPVYELVHHQPLIRVAFTHFILLGIATVFAVSYYFKTKILFYSFFIATCIYILILVVESMFLYPLLGLNFSAQWIYICCGVLLLLSLIFIRFRSKPSSFKMKQVRKVR